jgi:hypothetical protein
MPVRENRLRGYRRPVTLKAGRPQSAFAQRRFDAALKPAFLFALA